MMITINKDNSDNDENNDENDNDNNNDNMLREDSPHKGSIMLSFNVTFLVLNSSRISGDLRCHVPHVTSLWCDIFMQHRHICIVESSYD